jgi:hypothetical protein
MARESKGGRGDAGASGQPSAGTAVRSAPSNAAPPVGVALPPLGPAQEFGKLELKEHRALAGAFRKIAERIAADPAYSVMLAINPVLALEGYGVVLTPELRDHVLRTLQYRGPARERYEALVAQLTKALGGSPRPDDPAWLANLVFVQLGLPPRDTARAKPVYKAPPNAAALARIETLRPRRVVRYPHLRRSQVKSVLAFAPWQEAQRSLDLDAPLPDLPHAATAPDRLTLDELWFYKDQHHLVRDVLEFGILQRSALRIHTPDAFRRIAAGQQRSAFRLWIRSIRFKDRGS